MTKIRLIVPVLIIIAAVIGLALIPAEAQIVGYATYTVYDQPVVSGYAPVPGENWAVTDGTALFAFMITAQRDIVYQRGLAFPPAYNAPFTTFLNHTQTSNVGALLGYYSAFTLTSGVMINGIFCFDAVWASNTNTIALVELDDTLLLDSNGQNYFTPNQILNSTSGVSVMQTSGVVSQLSAVNLPNGDVVIGDSEEIAYGQFIGALYYYHKDTGLMSNLQSTAVSSFENICIKPAYVNGTLYYTIGRSWFNHIYAGEGSALVVYSIPLASAYIMNMASATLIASITAGNMFTVGTDSIYFYVAGEDGSNFWTYAFNNNVVVSEMALPEALIGADLTVDRCVFLVTHTGSVGVHFFFDYVNSTTHTLIGVMYSHDGGLTWAIDMNVIDITGVYTDLAAPPLTGAASTAWLYNSEINYVTSDYYTSAVYEHWVVKAYSFGLPASENVYASTTYTQAIPVIITSTTVVSTPTQITSDLFTPIVMLMWVAVPAAVFGYAGRSMGGGRAGVTLMLVGAGIGIFTGIIYGSWPSWTLIIVLLAIVAAYYNRGSGGQPEP